MNIKKRVFASALVIALAAAGVLISGGHNVAKAGPGAAPVSIVSPLPLPITGTATVSGTVGATQSGTWNVGVTGTPSVNVANTPRVTVDNTPNVNVANTPGVTVNNTPNVTVTNTAANPVINEDRDSDARGAFQTQLSLSLSGVSGNGLSIPPGTRLVIDYVSVAASGPPSGTQPYIIIFTTLGGGPPVSNQLTLTQSSLASQQFQDSERVKIYGDTAFVSLAFAGSTPVSLTANVAISGHLVNIP